MLWGRIDVLMCVVWIMIGLLSDGFVICYFRWIWYLDSVIGDLVIICSLNLINWWIWFICFYKIFLLYINGLFCLIICLWL